MLTSSARRAIAPAAWAALLAAAALAWVLTVRSSSGMSAGPGTMGRDLWEFLALWALMMAAMMLPAVAPVVSLYLRTLRARSSGWTRGFRSASLVVGYLSLAGLRPRGVRRGLGGLRGRGPGATGKDTGGTGIRLAHADRKFYTGDVAAACRRADARFSPATGMNPSIAAAIGRIGENTWRPIRYPDAFVDPGTGTHCPWPPTRPSTTAPRHPALNRRPPRGGLTPRRR